MFSTPGLRRVASQSMRVSDGPLCRQAAARGGIEPRTASAVRSMTKPTAKPDDQPSSLDLAATYAEHKPKLIRLLRRWSSPSEADDLLQQTFLRLVSMSDDETQGIRSPQAFLRRAAYNLVTDQARASRRRSAGSHVGLEEVTLPGPDPTAAFEARDMLNRLEAVIARMPARRREIFLAHRVDGYSYGEIAARTGLSVKGVEKQMSRAIAQIDRWMLRR